jgi:endonuclease IV
VPLIGSHATYLVNLGSGNPEVAAKSAEAVAHALRRGAEIGARGVVVHTGSAVGWRPDTGLTGTGGSAKDKALRQVREIALPPLDELGDDDPDLLFEPMAGLVHANDSLLGCGSKRDRHEAIGDGAIGTGPFGQMLFHPSLSETPFVVETPGGKKGHARDIATLKGLRGSSPAAGRG